MRDIIFTVIYCYAFLFGIIFAGLTITKIAEKNQPTLDAWAETARHIARAINW